MSRRRVVVTGLGAISPLGMGTETNWRNAIEGVSGIGPVTLFDAAGYTSRIAGEVRGFDPAAFIPEKTVRHMDRFCQFGVAAGVEAIRDSALVIDDANAHRVGVYIGSGIGGVKTIEDTAVLVSERGPRRVSPFYIPSSIINMVAGHLAILYNAKGPNLSIATACSSATHAIGEAGRLIEYGDADVMIAGGAEAGITPSGMAGFCNARAMSTRNDSPATASRPWDVHRDGFVLGEGAGVLVLEEYEHARARGARIYAELVGFGMSGDAFHITSPAEDGDGARRCMQNALANACVAVDEVDYVNAHGTSTQLGDLAETIALKRLFGYHASRLAVSSTKSMTGHLLGAAGGIEAIYTVLSIYHQAIPPTINLVDPDPQCDLDYVPLVARDAKVDVALSNSFGFGGTNGTLVFRKFQ